MIRHAAVLALLGASALCAGTAQAQGLPAACPAGAQAAVYRVSKVKPGKMDQFLKAVADQQAWYRAKGLTANSQKIGRILIGAGSVDPDQVVTLHLNAPVSAPTRDAGFEAFVAEFRDSSDMVTEQRLCLFDPR